MALEKQPFRSYSLDGEKPDDNFIVISLKLNKEEQAQLIQDKAILRQVKDGTAIKQLMLIGSKVIHEPKTATYLNIVLDNIRKNKRTGIADFD